ncbi:MAG TPA: hypothetical protein EYM49_01475 [Campylobacterales bacterium]|nr:hypothetical protein [Campylobacterales bacterium]
MKKIILPFIIVFSQSVFAESSSDMISSIVEQYKMLGKNKALVVAMDDDKYAAGWGFKFSNKKRAIAKAMKGCQKSRLNYQVSSECVVYMINNDKMQVANTVEEVAVDSSTVITSDVTPVDNTIEAFIKIDEQAMLQEEVVMD